MNKENAPKYPPFDELVQQCATSDSTTAYANSVFSTIEVGQRLNDEQLRVLGHVSNALAHFKILDLERQGRRLVGAERTQRDEDTKKRYYELRSKDSRTPEEEKELNDACGWLSQDH